MNTSKNYLNTLSSPEPMRCLRVYIILVIVILLAIVPILTLASPITDQSITDQLEHGGRVEAIILTRSETPNAILTEIAGELPANQDPIIQETYTELHATKIILTKPVLEELQNNSYIVGIFEDKLYHIFPDEIPLDTQTAKISEDTQTVNVTEQLTTNQTTGPLQPNSPSQEPLNTQEQLPDRKSVV